MSARLQIARCVAAVLGAFALSGWASDNGMEEYRQAMRNVEFYSWGWVGTPASISPGEAAARALARQSDSADIIRWIPDSTTAGKLYLLCILRRNAPSLYVEAKRSAGFAEDASVSTFSGTIFRSERVADVLGQIERGNCAPLNWPESLRSGIPTSRDFTASGAT